MRLANVSLCFYLVGALMESGLNDFLLTLPGMLTVLSAPLYCLVSGEISLGLDGVGAKLYFFVNIARLNGAEGR